MTPPFTAPNYWRTCSRQNGLPLLAVLNLWARGKPHSFGPEGDKGNVPSNPYG